MFTKRDFLRSVPLAAITTIVTMPKCAQAQSDKESSTMRRSKTLYGDRTNTSPCIM